MKRSILLLGAFLIFVLACQPQAEPIAKTTLADTPTSTSFIPLDSANRMIGSYIASLGEDSQHVDLHAISFDAAKLRQYLSDTTITSVKVSMAHTLQFINQGQYGHDAGYQHDALTLVISAFTASGQFVFHDNQVLDFGAQCPSVCPVGQAANDLFPVSSASHE